MLFCSRNSYVTVANSVLMDLLAPQNYLVYSTVKIISRIKIDYVLRSVCMSVYAHIWECVYIRLPDFLFQDIGCLILGRL